MKYTKEELQNTYGEVQSPEHAEFINSLSLSCGGTSCGFGVGDNVFWFEGVDLYFGEEENIGVCIDGKKQITIPLPPKEGVIMNNEIEWKEGSVCFVGGWYLYANNVDIRLDGEDIVKEPDFKLNTIKQGDFIAASELDTEQKYKDLAGVVEHIGFRMFSGGDYDSMRKYGGLVFDSDGDVVDCHEGNRHVKRNITFSQLMAIVELKRLINDRDKESDALTSEEETELKSRAMASQLSSQPNDEWPQVGDEVVTRGGSKGVVKISEPDRDGMIVCDFGGEYALTYKSELSKPKAPEDILIEELQTKLVENKAVDNWMLAANIISGDIKGLTYKSDIESAVKSVINKSLDSDL